MPDEPQSVVAGAEAPPAPEIPDLDPDTIAAVLNRYQDDPEKRAALVSKLRTHPLVSNLAGDLAQRQRTEYEQEAARKAVADKLAEQRRMADENPEELARQWALDFDKKAADKKLAEIRDTTRREYQDGLGTALRDIPEAKLMTASEHAELTNLVVSAPEDQQLRVFWKYMANLIADKRAQATAAEAEAKRAAAAEKAKAKNEADQKLKARVSPSVSGNPPGNAQDTGEPNWRTQPKEWEAWYEDKRKAGTLVRR